MGKWILTQQPDPFGQPQYVQQPGSAMMSNPSNSGAAQQTDIGSGPTTTTMTNSRPQVTPSKNPTQRPQSQASLLENLLLDNAQVLLKHIDSQNRLLQSQEERMKGKTQNKHSEETFKDIERK